MRGRDREAIAANSRPATGPPRPQDLPYDVDFPYEPKWWSM